MFTKTRKVNHMKAVITSAQAKYFHFLCRLLISMHHDIQIPALSGLKKCGILCVSLVCFSFLNIFLLTNCFCSFPLSLRPDDTWGETHSISSRWMNVGKIWIPLKENPFKLLFFVVFVSKNYVICGKIIFLSGNWQ